MNKSGKILRFFEVLVTATVLMGWATTAFPELKPASDLRQVTGKILAVDAVKGLLRIETSQALAGIPSAQRVDMVLAKNVVITDEAKALQPESLQVGTQVSVEYRIDDGRKIAETISVRKAEAAAAPAAQPEIQ